MNDKYVFETESLREMDLVINRYKMIETLSELKEWRRLLYRSKDYNNGHHLVDGKVYKESELIDNKELSRDERGLIKNISEKFYYQKDIINKIDEILNNVEDLLDRNDY